ncbi:MAG: TetR/AcrR family transcriptional regulator [Reyranellaceae bacterium]
MGRPRSFDTDTALTAATGVFLARGYDGASLDELTAAMGIARPSLYAAFGDKGGLYAAVLRRYGEAAKASMRRALQSGDTAEAAVRALLRGAVDAYAPPGGQGLGCLIATTATTVAAGDAAVRRALAEFLAEVDALVAQALEQRFGAAPVAVVSLITGGLYGLATRARAGASRRQLLAIADGTAAAVGTLMCR